MEHCWSLNVFFLLVSWAFTFAEESAMVDESSFKQLLNQGDYVFNHVCWCVCADHSKSYGLI